MKKRKRLIVLIIVLIIVLFVIVSGLVSFLYFGTSHLHDKISLWYYLHFTNNQQELPTRLIRPAFRYITKWDLPPKTDNLRAIFRGGRGLSMFVKFDTDSEGISYIERYVNELGGSFKVIDTYTWQSTFPVFPFLSRWEKKTGVHLFDPNSIKSGRDFWYRSITHTRILIDDQQRTVYIMVSK